MDLNPKKNLVSVLFYMWQSLKCLINLLIAVLFSPIEQVINEMTDGGADHCFECVGLSSLVHKAFACCQKVSLSLSVSLNTRPFSHK